MPFSLDGVRVLELARFQAGPRGGMMLSDLGAEVIKVERIGGEDPSEWVAHTECRRCSIAH
jgi:formyl-CoA transferase